MKQTVETIPVQDAFHETGGCPLCRLEQKKEAQDIAYVSGAAMMEPDIRMMTNTEGFCKDHYALLQQQSNRLPLALLLQSHLQELLSNTEKLPAKKEAAALAGESCFICRRLRETMQRMLETVCHLYQVDPAFRDRYQAQEYLCPKHFKALMGVAAGEIPKKVWPAFWEDTAKLYRESLSALLQDISDYCALYDYRSGSAQPTEQVRTAIERTIDHLTGEK